VDDYVFSIMNDGEMVEMEQGTDVPGSPICCEVCAVDDTADDVCETTCKHDLCSRARDSHVSAGLDLAGIAGCGVTDCGFGFESCMSTNLLHPQSIIAGDFALFYALQASCHAHADEAARLDGLFTYLENLDGIPGASRELDDVQDVVGYCLDLQATVATGMPPDPSSTAGTSTPFDDGADSSGGGTTTGQMPDVGQGSTPESCGPVAVERFWVRPTNNFGAWNETSGGVHGMGASTQAASITGGGISYTLFPCAGAPDTECIRIDRLSVQLTEAGSGLVMRLRMMHGPQPAQVSAQGSFYVPRDALRVMVSYEWDDQRWQLAATNAELVRGRLDTNARTVLVEGLSVASQQVSTRQGDVLATLVLEASLANTQPKTEIGESRDPRDGRMLLTAETVDADRDDVVHRWMIPGIGSWRGDVISPTLPAGRHAVILYADDAHRARGVAARWLEIAPTAHTGGR
jgi:hypothetical protein